MAPPTSSLRSGYVSIFCAVLIWAGWMVSTRFLAKGTLTPYDITALRFAVAGVALLPVVFQRGWKVGPHGFIGSVILCALMGPLYILICTKGMTYAPASHAAAIINGFMVMTSTLLGVIWLKEPFSHRKKVGIAILLVGMGCVVWARTGGRGSLGHLFFAIGGMMWAGYGLCLRRWNVSSWHGTAVTSVLAAVFYLPFYSLFATEHLSGASWGLLTFHGIYQGLLTAILALFLYGKAVHTLGASTAAAFVPMVPVLTLLLGIPLLGEVPGPLEIVGVALVFTGLLVVVLKTSRRHRAPLPAP